MASISYSFFNYVLSPAVAISIQHIGFQLTREVLSDVDKVFLLKKFSFCVLVSQSVISVSKLPALASEQKVYYCLIL